jgi:hypothetical protein
MCTSEKRRPPPALLCPVLNRGEKERFFVCPNKSSNAKKINKKGK